MNLELPPETETWLHQQAAKSGMTSEQFALMILRNQAAAKPEIVEDQPARDHDQ